MDSKNTLAEMILQDVKSCNGIKLSALIKQINYDLKIPMAPFEITNLVNELVSQKKLMEVEFTSDMFQVESFLLPAKTKVNIRGEAPEEPHRI
jgi:hypothetical protein